MRRFKRSLPILLSLLLLGAAVAVVVVLRKHAPPEPARLLPGADGFVYFNLQWLRRTNVADHLPDVVHDPDYQQFIQRTGFQFERDLEQVAFAVHYPPAPKAGRTSIAPEDLRFSGIFVGKIDGNRLRDYLHGLAKSVENYNSTEIYSIPLQERTFRVAVLAVDMVATSNHPDPQVIRGMVDRSRKLASPFGGAALLRQYYKQVPFASLSWAIFRADPAMDRAANSPFGLSFLFGEPAVVVVSARYLTSLNLRAEAFTSSEQAATQVTDRVNTFLSLFHAAENSVHPQGPDPDVKQFFDSLKIERDGSRAVLTASMTPAFMQKAIEGPAAAASTPPAGTPTQKPGPNKTGGQAPLSKPSRKTTIP